MEEYIVSILQSIGGLFFVQPLIGVFEYYLDKIRDKEQLRESLEYHTPLLMWIIDKYKKDE